MNLLIDTATLGTTAWVRRIRPNPWRVLAAASIGASYVVMMFFPTFSFMFTFIIKCFFAVVMLLAAFGFGSLQHFLRSFGVFYLINFVVAGGIFAVHYFMQSSHEVMNGILFTQSGGLRFELKVGGLFVIIIVPVLIWFYRKVIRSGERREELTNYFAETHVYIDQHYSTCIGLIDTGNQLYDPLTRTPVMVMEATHWKDVLPPSWLKRIEHGESDDILKAIGTEEFIWQDRLRIIPYKGIQKGSQFMIAIKPDKVVVIHQDVRYETSQILIGLNGGKLSTDGSYKAIIHPTLMNTHRR